MTITQTVELPANRRITLDVPNEIPMGKVNVIIFPVWDKATASAQENEEPLEGRGFGCHKGKIWIADDFCEPIDDFKDYM